jgi:hypothetical protein
LVGCKAVEHISRVMEKIYLKGCEIRGNERKRQKKVLGNFCPSKIL